MAFGHGKDVNLSIDDKDNSVTAIETYLTSANLSRPKETADTTPMGQAYVSRIAGLPEGGTLDFDGFADATLDAILIGILGNTSIGGALCDYSYTPDAGTTTYSGDCTLTSYSISTSTGAAATFSASAQLSGAVARA